MLLHHPGGRVVRQAGYRGAVAQTGDDVLVALVVVVRRRRTRRRSSARPGLSGTATTRNANGELSITANALRFCTRSCAAVRLAPDDWSSMYSTLILRPLTPPLAFCASTLAWHALSRVLERRGGDAGLRRDVTDRDVLVGHPGIGARLRAGSGGGQTGDRETGHGGECDQAPRALAPMVQHLTPPGRPGRNRALPLLTVGRRHGIASGQTSCCAAPMPLGEPADRLSSSRRRIPRGSGRALPAGRCRTDRSTRPMPCFRITH